MNIGVYAGSFDPFTRGHGSVLGTASSGFDKIIVAVGYNPAKAGLFTVKERVSMIQGVIDKGFFSCPVEVDSFEGLLMKYCVQLSEQEKGRRVVIIRGLRAVSDFEQEMAIAETNRHLHPLIPTFFVPATGDYAFVSSSAAKQLAMFQDADETLEQRYVFPDIARKLRKKMRKVPAP